MRDKCFEMAKKIKKSGYSIGDISLEDLTNLLMKLEIEKQEKDLISDSNIDYNDEIVSIEELGVLETIDISVTGDNLFYCNNILTKNSFGLPATADLQFALITSEELETLNQLLVKQLKNRYKTISPDNRRFVIGVDRSKMRLYDIDDAQEGLTIDKPVMDNTTFGEQDYERNKKKPAFNGFK